MTDVDQVSGPSDPPTHEVAYADDGKRFTCTRSADRTVIGIYDTREAAVAAGWADALDAQ